MKPNKDISILALITGMWGFANTVIPNAFGFNIEQHLLPNLSIVLVVLSILVPIIKMKIFGYEIK